MQDLDYAALAAEPILPGKENTEGQVNALLAIFEWLDLKTGRERKYTRKYSTNLPAELEDWFRDDLDEYFVLKGYAGTGKTTLIGRLVVLLSQLGWNIAVTAPTNKAVGVLQEKVKDYAGNRVICSDFRSIHSCVGLRMVESDSGELVVSQSGFSTLDSLDLVIVDEASMVDTNTVFRAIQQSRGECRVLMVGDPAQLPPVNEGRTARVFSLPNQFELTEITRQAAGNPLIQFSMHLRSLMDQGERASIVDFNDLMPESVISGGRRALARLAVDLQRSGKDARILAYKNATVLDLNEQVHFSLFPDAGNMLFSAGERVIVQSACKVTDVDTGEITPLMTSEELTIRQVFKETHHVYKNVNCYVMCLEDSLGHFVTAHVPVSMRAHLARTRELFDKVTDAKRQAERGVKGMDLAMKEARNAAWAYKNSFCELRHTYASTTHKAQGSTFDVALIDLQDLQTMNSTFEFNRALYVDVTRPREYCRAAY